MKSSRFLTFLLLPALVSLPAGSTWSQQREALPELKSARVIERGSHHAKWETVQEVADPVTGARTEQGGTYIQLESGLNYQDESGNWQESRPEIVLDTDAAVAAGVAYRAEWKASPNQEKLFQFLGANGEYLGGSVLAIAYFDRASGASAVLGTIRDAAGYVENGNQVIYPAAFEGIDADIRYTALKAGIEQDVILRERPPSPEQLGLNPDTTQLEIWTEFFETADPVAKEMVVVAEPDPIKRQAMREPDVVDELLDFGTYQMVMGRAFAESQQGPAHEGEPLIMVSKRWLQFDDRRLLVEVAPYARLKENLEALPERVAAVSPPSPPTLHAGRGVLPLLPASSKDQPVRLARAENVNRGDGFVMDFIVVASTNNLTFLSTNTYHVTGNVSLTGTTTFQGGTKIKYANAPGAKLVINGGGVSSGGGTVWLTCEDDDTVGVVIPPAGGQSGRYAEAYLDFYNAANNLTLSLFEFRFASKAISSYSNAKHILSYSRLIGCNLGIQAYYTDWDIYYSTYCGVPTPTYNYYGSTFTTYGYFSDNCNPDSDGDGMSDGYELTNFDQFNYNVNSDPDGDGLSITQEWNLGYAVNNPDTDSDGILDGLEDYDGDGLANVSDPQPGTANGSASFAGKTLPFCPQ